MPEQDGLMQIKGHQDHVQVFGEPSNFVPKRRYLGSAVSTHVQGDKPIAVVQSCKLILELRSTLGPARNQDYRLPFSRFYVVQRYTVAGGDVARFANRFGHRRVLPRLSPLQETLPTHSA